MTGSNGQQQTAMEGELGRQTVVCLLRHGMTDWNIDHRYQGRADTPLNAEGKGQVERVARWLSEQTDEPWDVIISSPLARAWDTATAVAAALGIPEDQIIREPDLMERAYGEAEGMTLAEREAKWPDPDWPGLETWDDLAKRSLRVVQQAAEDYAGKRVLAVCHGGVINAILAVLSQRAVGTGESIIINTSMTTLTYDGSAWTIGEISAVPHLETAAAD